MPRVYIETTVVSYLVSRLSRDMTTSVHQQTTHDWWRDDRHRYELVTSRLVVSEAAAGDPVEAEKRLNALQGLMLLEVTPDAFTLAQELIFRGAIPAKAKEDALHLAVAVVNGIHFLLTWNCKHLANANLRERINDICLDLGYTPTVICTPDELRKDD